MRHQAFDGSDVISCAACVYGYTMMDDGCDLSMRQAVFMVHAGAQSGLRAYVPNVMYGDWADPPTAATDSIEPSRPLPASTVLGLGLVA